METISQLYLRNLTEEQALAINQLQERFSEKTAVKGVTHAIMQFLNLEKDLQMERELTMKLRKENADLLKDFNDYKSKVNTYFEQKEQVSKLAEELKF